IRRLYLRCRGLDTYCPRGPSRSRTAIRFHARTWSLAGADSLRFQQHQRGGLGTLFGVSHPALHAARRSTHFARLPADAFRVLEQDVVQSHAFAQQEVERYTYRAPGQANSYFYGYTKLIALRKDVEAALGAKFNQKKFHDFILAQGLLPPD